MGKLVTKEILADHLSISVAYVNKLMSEEALPYVKIGRSVRYSLSEVESWLLKRQVGRASEIITEVSDV